MHGHVVQVQLNVAGEQRRQNPLNVADLADEHDPATILILDEAISHLQKRDAMLGQAVRLRFYAGLSIKETARMADAPGAGQRKAFIEALHHASYETNVSGRASSCLANVS